MKWLFMLSFGIFRQWFSPVQKLFNQQYRADREVLRMDMLVVTLIVILLLIEAKKKAHVAKRGTGQRPI